MVTNSKKTWTQPKLVSLGNEKIKSAMNPTNGFAEYYTLVSCASSTPTDTAAIASLMAACSMNGVSGDSFTYNLGCVATAANPSSWSPGNTTSSSTFAFGCCAGGSPFGGAHLGGLDPAAAVFAATGTAMAACS